MDKKSPYILVLRNLESTPMRDARKNVRSKKQKEEQQIHQLKWAGKKEADTYANWIAQELRDRFAFSN